jgi:hypothetical protein
MISSNGLPSHPPMCASTSSSSTVTSVPASRANASAVSFARRSGEEWVPLLASRARPWLALPAEIGLTVPDQVQDAFGHAGAESVVERLGGAGGWVARQ